MPRHSALKLVLVIVLLFPLRAPAQTEIPADVAKDVESRFKDKVLPLRHVLNASSVKYDETGKLAGKPKPGDWTLHGYLEITAAEFKNSTFTIKGNRVALSFENWATQKTPKYIRTTDELEIQIVATKDGTFSLEQELAKAFLPPTEEFPENLPDHWRRFLCTLRELKEQCPVKSLEIMPAKVGDGVTEPRLLRQEQPSYSTAARSARLNGQVELMIVVDTNGRPTIYEVRKPLGLGLDEKSIEAVKEWTFEPGKRDGVPIAVVVSVLVNFSLRKE
jgi:TonB family protein